MPTLGWKKGSGATPECLWTKRCEIWDRGHFVCVLKFDSPLPEDHRVNILSTTDSLHHHLVRWWRGSGLSDAPWVTIYDFVYPRPTPSRHRETLGRRSDKVSAPPDYACKRKGQKTVKSHGIRDRNHTHSNDDTMGSGIESIPYTQCANFANSSLIPRNHLRFTIFFTHGNVSILKTQRRIHGDARRPCRRSSPRFLLFTPPRVFFEPGTSATRLLHRGRIAEIFA